MRVVSITKEGFLTKAELIKRAHSIFIKSGSSVEAILKPVVYLNLITKQIRSCTLTLIGFCAVFLLE